MWLLLEQGFYITSAVQDTPYIHAVVCGVIEDEVVADRKATQSRPKLWPCPPQQGELSEAAKGCLEASHQLKRGSRIAFGYVEPDFIEVFRGFLPDAIGWHQSREG